MSQATLRQTISRVGLLPISIMTLAVATALVHLYRGLSMGGMGGNAGGFSGGGLSGNPPTGSFPMGGPPARGSLIGNPPAKGPFIGNPPVGGAPGGGGSIGMSILSHLPVSLSVLFLLNFVGYIVLVVALYLPPLRRFQRIMRWTLIIYTAITVVMWFLVTGGSSSLLAYIDKPIEIALIVLLIIEDRQAVRFGRDVQPVSS